MASKKFVVSLLVLLVCLSFVSAITGSTRSGRMIIRGDVGDNLQKFVIVQNVNDVDIRIELFAAGDLEEFIDIIDTNFTLLPGTEKKAYFNLEIGKPGTTESSVNMRFTPVDGKNGIGLSSTIIVIADGTSNEDLYEDQRRVDDEDEDVGIDNPITGGVVGDGEEDVGVNWGVISLLIVFVVLLVGVLCLVLIKPKKPIKSKKSLKKRG